jgi:NTE family protein
LYHGTNGMSSTAKPVRSGVVLSAGGLRGTAHLGVMRQILRTGTPIDVMVGVSAGAIIAAYWAAVGLTIEDMIGDAPIFRGRHIVMHGLTLRMPMAVRPHLRRFCGVIPKRISQLEAGKFERTFHGVQQLGVVCHDLLSNSPVYFSTDQHHGATLAEVVKASAAVPGVLPSRALTLGDRHVRLVDGGITDSLPVDFARHQLGATHIIVSDCRYEVSSQATGDNILYIRPQLNGMKSMRSPRAKLVEAVAAGEASVTDEMVQQLRAWTGDRARSLQAASPRRGWASAATGT